jgi:chemotaxis protein methyltransferase CheR
MTPPPPSSSLHTPAFNYIRKLVRVAAAIVIDADKQYMVESRLGPLLQVEELGSLTALVARLQARPDPDLQRRVVEALAISETYFFRDSRPFLALEETILPELIASRSAHRSLRIWSAAASSGQEAYSIAMLIRERFPDLESWKLTVLGTDISLDALARARKGEFSGVDVQRGLSPTLLAKYFSQAGEVWTLTPEIRQMVEFRALNLAEPWPALPQMDIVFLRNVLIYFDAPIRKVIFERLHGVIRPGGYLFLGNAETTPPDLSKAFTRVQLGSVPCYRAQ